MICPGCNTANKMGVAFCVGCGARLPVAGPANRRGLALAALLLGIISLPLIYVFELSTVTGLAAAACGAIALVNAKRRPLEFGGKELALVGGGLGALVALLFPVWASLVIPARARARMAVNEAAALADVRAVIAAERLYALSNRDYYDTFDCLTRPQECIPGSTSDGASVMDAALATTATRKGYGYELFLGPKPSVDADVRASASSATSFAYVATPTQSKVTGARAFCGDDTGAIRAAPSGAAAIVKAGRCPENWAVLE
jgi:hypothetical protein